MAVREVIRMGHPLLREVAKTVSKEEILSDEMKELLVDMRDSMEHYGGIGIAAPQIGISQQISIISLPSDSDRYEEAEETPLYCIFNPKIEVLDEETQGFWEGCLSVPGLRGFVERPQKIKVTYLNEKAEENEMTLEGFLATVFQHEIDHLFGKLYVDRIKDTKLLSYEEEFVHFWAKNSHTED